MNLFSSVISFASETADLFGIIGFLLSLTLAVIELLRHRMRLRLSHVEFYSLGLTDDMLHFFIRAFVENRSSASASITGTDIFLSPRLRCPARLGEHIILGITTRNCSTKKSHREEILNSPLPITLGAYESREIFLVYRCRLSQPQQYQLPDWILFRAPDPSLPESSPTPHKFLWFSLSSTRGRRRHRVSVDVRSAEELMKTLRRKNDLRL